MKIKNAVLLTILFSALFLLGCQGQPVFDAAAVDEPCEEYSELGQCVARAGWPQPPDEILILSMPVAKTEPPVPFSHQAHSEIGCERCHESRPGQLVEEIDFRRT